MPNDIPVWFITGCSTGFGRDLAGLVLERGWRAAVTARNVDSVQDLVARSEGRGVALPLDVTDMGQIAAAVGKAEERFGGIDVLVNNAGYGYQASVEEGDEAEIRAMFDANVFGLAALIRATLPGMRARRRGHIVNISSVAGFVGFPGSGYYAATKHAVEGLSDSLRREVEPLGIRVTCIEPGPFRTDWAGRSLKQTQSKVDDYRESVGERLRATSGYSGTQPGDPVRAAAAMIDAVQAETPPKHLVLGAFGVEAVRAQLTDVVREIDLWRETSLGADFPKSERV